MPACNFYADEKFLAYVQAKPYNCSWLNQGDNLESAMPLGLFRTAAVSGTNRTRMPGDRKHSNPDVGFWWSGFRWYSMFMSADGWRDLEPQLPQKVDISFKASLFLLTLSLTDIRINSMVFRSQACPCLDVLPF